MSMLPVICWDAPLSTVHLPAPKTIPYKRLSLGMYPFLDGSSFVSNKGLWNPNRPMIIITIGSTNIFSINMTIPRFHKNIRGVIFSGKVIVSGGAPCGLTTHNGVGLLFFSHPLLYKDNILGGGSRLLLLLSLLLGLGNKSKTLLPNMILLIAQKVIETLLSMYA